LRGGPFLVLVGSCTEGEFKNAKKKLPNTAANQQYWSGAVLSTIKPTKTLKTNSLPYWGCFGFFKTLIWLTQVMIRSQGVKVLFFFIFFSFK